MYIMYTLRCVDRAKCAFVYCCVFFLFVCKSFFMNEINFEINKMFCDIDDCSCLICCCVFFVKVFVSYVVSFWWLFCKIAVVDVFF